MARAHYPSLDLVREWVREENGALFWNWRAREHFGSERGWKIFNARFAGKEAGALTWTRSDRSTARVQLWFPGTYVLRSIIVWALHNGRWPENHIDHEDGDRMNDRIDNLRHATRSQNAANRGSDRDNKSGFKGVSKSKNGKRWLAFIHHGKKSRYLGGFPTPELAHTAYMQAAREHFGEFANDGGPNESKPPQTQQSLF